MPRRTATTSAPGRGRADGVLPRRAVIGHRSSPFISCVGVATSASASSWATSRRRFDAELGVLDLLVELEDRVHQHLRAGRAARQVHVDRHDVVDALHHRVVVEHAARRRAHAHRQHPLGLGHLVVDLAQHRRHLLADPAGHDHQVGLPRRGAEDLHAEPRQVVAAGAGRHHLDRAAGQAERRRPQRALAHVADQLLDRREQDAARQLLLDPHRRPLRRRRRQTRMSPLSPTRARRDARRRRTRGRASR